MKRIAPKIFIFLRRIRHVIISNLHLPPTAYRLPTTLFLPPTDYRLPITTFFLACCLLLAACQNQPKDQTASIDALTAPLTTPPPAPSIDPRITDLARITVGKEAPDFVLEDINSNIVRLSDYRAQKNVILVFYRGHF